MVSHAPGEAATVFQFPGTIENVLTCLNTQIFKWTCIVLLMYIEIGEFADKTKEMWAFERWQWQEENKKYN